MAEYFVIKREKCPCPCGTPLQEGVATMDVMWGDPFFRCKDSGFIETHVDLLDVLVRLRFSIGEDDGRSCLIDPRLEDE